MNNNDVKVYSLMKRTFKYPTKIKCELIDGTLNIYGVHISVENKQMNFNSPIKVENKVMSFVV